MSRFGTTRVSETCSCGATFEFASSTITNDLDCKRAAAAWRVEHVHTATDCGCSTHCGDDDDVDGSGVCRGLPRAPEPPLVELVTVHRGAAIGEGGGT